MYERFTDRARKVMQFANQEAIRLCHEYIGTEHVLLGIEREWGGMAAQVLRFLGVTREDIRNGVESFLQPGPEIVTMGRLPQTPRCKRVIEGAMRAGVEMKSNHIGTEHILLGLLSVPEGVANTVLDNLGVTTDGVHKASEQLINNELEKVVQGQSYTFQDALKYLFFDPAMSVALNGMTPERMVQFASQRLKELDSRITKAQEEVRGWQRIINAWSEGKESHGQSPGAP